MAWLQGLLLLWIAMASAEPGENYAGNAFTISPTDHRKTYTLAVYSSGWHEEHPRARQLIDEAFRWNIERYRQAYPQIEQQDPTFFAKMMSKDSPLDGRSFFAVMYEGTNSGKIVGTLRFTFLDGKPGLPGEETLGGWKFERPPIEVNSHCTTFVPEREWTEAHLTGNLVEIKNFVKAPDADEDVLPLLLSELEVQSSLRYTLKSFSYRPRVPHSQSSQASTRVDLTRFEPLDVAKIQRSETMPSRYVLACDEHLRPYYEKLGFKVVFQKENLFGMQMTREDFLGLSRKLKGRPGARLLDFSLRQPALLDMLKPAPGDCFRKVIKAISR